MSLSEMSAQKIVSWLFLLREELEELWTNGTLDKEVSVCTSELYTILSIFFSDHEKLQYDRKRNLDRLREEGTTEVEDMSTNYFSNQTKEVLDLLR